MVNERIKMTIEELEDLIGLAASSCVREYDELDDIIVSFIAACIAVRVNHHLTGKEPFSADELKVVREIRESFHFNKALHSMEGGE